MQRIHIASDHAGFVLKQELVRHLADRGCEVTDDGVFTEESCDYPVLAHKLCRAVAREGCPGILLCGSGIGMSMAANRHSGIRAALCTTELHAKLARQHNNANVLCLGARITGLELAVSILATFLENNFEVEGVRHARRVSLITPDAENQ
ncbi:MAG: ribose 5-phosphate isomerase B [Desulfovibrio sp.]|jgi:ribose 5-phosphate isomerase B|nr:ribose 5-phosphate isomerase B [Desulfovibrio sp.]